MYCISGIGYWWFLVLFGLIVVGLILFIGIIVVVGVEIMVKVFVFGYVVKWFNVFFDLFKDLIDLGY